LTFSRFPSSKEVMGRLGGFLFACWLLLSSSGCSRHGAANEFRVALSADYPPFEFTDKGEVVGFDVDLARAVAHALGRTAVFHDMNFCAILPSIQAGMVDAGISTITATASRIDSYAFSDPYFYEELHIIFRAVEPIKGKEDLRSLKVACQLGSTMEIWLRKHGQGAKIIPMDSNVQAIEALKAGLVDALVVDSFQAQEFCARNGTLDHIFLERSGDGYAVALRKDSPLLSTINDILGELDEDGTIAALREKWKLQ
jgi:polar amino acid transport system substrate-binding protein